MQDSREALSIRWHQVNRLLDDLANGKVVEGANPDPTAREAELLSELDRIEYEIGMLDTD